MTSDSIHTVNSVNLICFNSTAAAAALQAQSPTFRYICPALPDLIYWGLSVLFQIRCCNSCTPQMHVLKSSPAAVMEETVWLCDTLTYMHYTSKLELVHQGRRWVAPGPRSWRTLTQSPIPVDLLGSVNKLFSGAFQCRLPPSALVTLVTSQ